MAVGDITLVRNPGKGVFAMKLQDKNDGICAAELSAIPMEGQKLKPQEAEISKSIPKYGGTRAGKGSVIIQKGTLGGWQWPVQRFDLLHSQDDDSDSSTEASSEDSSTSETPRQTAQREATLFKKIILLKRQNSPLKRNRCPTCPFHL